MTQELSDICNFVEERVAVANLTVDNYVSTENMFPNKDGITRSAGVPSIVYTRAYRVKDILVSNIRPYFRKIWFADRDGGCSTDVLVLRAKKNCTPGFLYYLLSNDKFFDYATATAKGTKMPRGDKEALMQYSVPDMPLAIQIDITDVLSTLDARIAVNRTINHNLEQMAQAIFKNWFVDFAPWSGEQPADWHNGVLSEIAPLVYSGGTPNTGITAYWDGNIPWLSSGETRNHFIISPENFITQEGVDNSSTRLAHRFDIVMASAGQGSTRGQTSLLMFDSYVNQSVIVMSGPYPLYLFLNLSGRYTELRAISDSSSIRGSITTKMLAQLPILVPSKNVLEKFALTISPLIGQIENNLNESMYLATLRDTLLPRLMSGELSVANLQR